MDQQNHPLARPLPQPTVSDTEALATHPRVNAGGRAGSRLDPEHQVIFPYGVGVDTHSTFIQVCVLYRSSQTIRRAEHSFPTDWPSLVKAHAWTLKVLIGIATELDLRYCIESTGTYHLPVLMSWRGVPTVVNPLLAGSTKRKTDVLDAQLLAHHSITGLWKTSFIPSAQAQELRVLWAQRSEHARTATRSSNRLNNILLRFGHTIGAHLGIRSPEGQSAISDLIEGRKLNLKCVAPDGLPESTRGIIATLLQTLTDSQRAAASAERIARDFVRVRMWPTADKPMLGSELLDLLQSVPGVGQTTSLAWLSEVTDPRRFQTAKQVAAYSGCDPSLKVSAGKVTSFTRRQGNSRLHYALSNAASGLLRSAKEPLGLYGRSIAGRHKRGGYKKACGALSRRIACALWYVHSKAELFSYEKYTFSQVPNVPGIPVQDIVGKSAARILKVSKITTSEQLVKAYYQGQLSIVIGFGELSIQKLRAWIDQHKDYSKHPVKLSTKDRPSIQSGLTKTGGKSTYQLNQGKIWQPKPKKKT